MADSDPVADHTKRKKSGIPYRIILMHGRDVRKKLTGKVREQVGEVIILYQPGTRKNMAEAITAGEITMMTGDTKSRRNLFTGRKKEAVREIIGTLRRNPRSLFIPRRKLQPKPQNPLIPGRRPASRSSQSRKRSYTPDLQRPEAREADLLHRVQRMR